MKTIRLLNEMSVYSGNVKNAQGNKVRKDKTLPAGQYEVVKEWTDTGMVRHGNLIVQVKSDGFTFNIDTTDVKRNNIRYFADKIKAQEEYDDYTVSGNEEAVHFFKKSNSISYEIGEVVPDLLVLEMIEVISN